MRRNFIWDLALSKLYSNCLLSTLNARASLQFSSRSTVDYHSAPRHNPGTAPCRRNDGFSMEAMSPARGSTYINNPGLLTGIDSVQNFIRPYDLENGKSLDQHPDLEYGITITKVRRKVWYLGCFDWLFLTLRLLKQGKTRQVHWTIRNSSEHVFALYQNSSIQIDVDDLRFPTWGSIGHLPEVTEGLGL